MSFCICRLKLIQGEMNSYGKVESFIPKEPKGLMLIPKFLLFCIKMGLEFFYNYI